MATVPQHRAPTSLICVADVDTRLTCSTCCAACRYWVQERRHGERRAVPRDTAERRVLGRV